MERTSKGPGRSHRKGISHRRFFQLFPDNAAAEQWFVAHRWQGGIRCPHCGCDNIQTGGSHPTMPYRCRKSKKGGCGRFFSVKTGTFMEASNVGYLDWLYALFLVASNLKSVSSMKLHRDINVTQRTAWHMAHRIRKALSTGDGDLFAGPVEVDETYVGGRQRNMSNARREALPRGGASHMSPVVGARDRETGRVAAKVVDDTTGPTLQGFVRWQTIPGTAIYTDEATAYASLPNHDAVRHSASEYVRGRVHTNGIESFWATLKRAHKGAFHRLSPKHLHRHVDEFVGRHNFRDMDTLEQMAYVAAGMDASRLRYKDLVA